MPSRSGSFYDDSKSPEPAAASTSLEPVISQEEATLSGSLAETTLEDSVGPPKDLKPQIGFCGLGAMGYGMATHLLRKGYPVKGFDVLYESRQRFEKAGGLPTTSLARSAEGSLFYICMVATAQQAQTALFDPKDSIVRSLPENATLLLCSTVPATYAISVEEQLQRRRKDSPIYFVDCPVSGGAMRAANGTLSIMAGASVSALTKARFLLDELTEDKKLYLVPGGIGQGSNMKMAHQVLAAIHILAVSEVLGYAARLGLTGKEVYEFVVGDEPGSSKAWSWMFENRAPRVLAQNYLPGVSTLTIILKDTGIITASARELRFPATLCTVAEQIYLLGLARGYGPEDDAGMVRLYHPDPVDSISKEMSVEDKARARTLVQNLLEGIHFCATFEALALARTLKLPVAQFIALVNNAAGASTIFRTWSQRLDMEKTNVYDPGAILLLGQVPIAALQNISDNLTVAVAAGQSAKCPLPLATGAMDMVLSALRVGAERRL